MAITKEAQKTACSRQRCPEHSLRIAPRRALIHQKLSASNDHPSPEALYERVPRRPTGISSDTVCRSLSTFRENGVVDVVEGHGTGKRFDPTTTNHPHCRCVRSETILEFNDETYDALPVPDPIRRPCDVRKIRVSIEGLRA
jgi:Fur family peroxide stress response transcriptional regulator